MELTYEEKVQVKTALLDRENKLRGMIVHARTVDFKFYLQGLLGEVQQLGVRIEGELR